MLVTVSTLEKRQVLRAYLVSVQFSITFQSLLLMKYLSELCLEMF